jgi:BetR domain.
MSYQPSLRAAYAGALRAEMARQHKTSQDLADVLSISQSSASRRMNGQVPIDLDEVYLVAQWLDVPLSTLLATEKVVA